MVQNTQVKCGAAGVLYTYPAWTFGGKRSGVPDAAGPGAGKYGPFPVNDTRGPGFGPGRSPAPARTGTAPPPYMPPLADPPRGPTYSFGNRLNGFPNGNPGPGEYSPNATHPGPYTPSWGPPPRIIRPASAPRYRPEERPQPKAKGPTMGLPWYNPKQDPTPGPNAYHLPCGCKACDGYGGVTIKGRQPVFYGKVTTRTPGPAGYHVDCSTIGAATMVCDDVKNAGKVADSQRRQQQRRQ